MHPLVLRSLRLLVATAGIAMLTGLSMYAFPTRFSTTFYGPLVPYLGVVSPLLVGAGISLLLLARYPMPGWVQRALLTFAVGMMGLLSAGILAGGGITGGITYAILSLGLIFLPGRSPSRQPAAEVRYDLFDLVLGVIEAVAGGVMLAAPGLFVSAAFDMIRPIFPVVGIVGLVAGGLLISTVTVPRLRSLDPWAGRLPGTVLPLIMVTAFYRTQVWTGVVLWGMLAASLLFGNLGLIEEVGKARQRPAVSVAPEELLTSRLEEILEGWLWLLALLVITLTGLGDGALVSSPVRAVLFVICISFYNAFVHWVVPHWGNSGQRIMTHVIALMAGSALLLGDTGAIGRPMLALLVVIPALAARGLSSRQGILALGLSLVVVVGSGLDHWLRGQNPGHVLAETVADGVILLAASSVGLRSAMDQRRAMQSLGLARAELTRQVQELSLIDRLGRAIRGSLELDRTIQTVVDELGPALQAERCFIRLIDQVDPYKAAFAREYVAPTAGNPIPFPHNLGPAGSLAARSRTSIAVADVQTDPVLENPPIGSRQDLLGMGIRAVLTVPIQTEGEMLGVITFHMFSGPRVWSLEEQRFVEAVAGQVAVAILHARSHDALRHRLAQLNAAHQRLQARDAKLVAQQEELQAQHEELLAQSEELQAERDKLDSALRQIRSSEQARERLVAVLESTSDFVVILNRDLQVYYINQTVRKLFGLPESTQEVQVDLRQWYTQESLRLIQRSMFPGLARHGIWSGELTAVNREGRPIPLSQVAIAHKDEAGNVLFYSTVARDITATKRAEEELRQSESRFRTTFSQAPIGMALVTPAGRIFRANDALCEMLGYTEEELLEVGVAGISDPEDAREQAHHIDRLRRREIDTYQNERRYRHRSGRVVWTTLSVSAVRSPDGDLEYLISHLQDITARKRSEEELVHLANYDPLTRLYNRRRLQEELEHEIASAQRYGHESALLYLDLDQFKYVNDTLGHQSGDALLVSLAAMLKERLRRTDCVARLGGDEFAIILPHVDATQAVAVADSLIKAIRGHVEVAGSVSYGISASIGITLFPTQGATVEEVLANADLAMYQAKEDGRNGYCLYAPDLVKAHQMENRLTWRHRISQALENGGLELHCQPIYDLAAGRVSQYELLIRMRGEDGQLYYPAAFLEVAERFGLIVALDRWVIGQAIDQITKEKQAGRRIVLGVNLSGKTFADAEVVGFIRDRLNTTGIDPTCLIFEVTETAAIADKLRAREFLEALQAMGCRIALDDFGTGFSSFAYLKQLPFDFLKIDGSFIQRLPSDPVDQRVVKAIVDLARGLGKQTIAEFAEDAATLQLLIELGVDYAQGYHVGAPAPLPEALRVKPKV